MRKIFRSPLVASVIFIFFVALGLSLKSAFFGLPQIRARFESLGHFWLYGILISYILTIIYLSFFRYLEVWSSMNKFFGLLYLLPIVCLGMFALWAFVKL